MFKNKKKYIFVFIIVLSFLLYLFISTNSKQDIDDSLILEQEVNNTTKEIDNTSKEETKNNLQLKYSIQGEAVESASTGL